VLHGSVGFLFGAIKANPRWSTALMPVVFLASAIVSGIGVLVLLYLFLSWKRGRQSDYDCVRALSRALWISLMIAVRLEMLELVHIAYEAGEEWRVIKELLTTRLAVS
jgi:formate-dependent nitrite reductase membrane component NrfD